jgi:hypothetical protein
LAADLLQSTINKAFLKGVLRAPFSSDFAIYFPIVQYADDTHIIMQACTSQITVMKDILNKYALSTGLQINFHKSSQIPMNISNNISQSIAGLLGCTIVSMPFTYLGFPVGTTKPIL